MAQSYLRSIAGTNDLPSKFFHKIADIEADFLTTSREGMTILPAGRINSDSGKLREDN